ncbi:hypothetical protein AN931_26540 [Mycobacterium intracellulare subsp. chimaera]|jgi:hypothetical protein|nr:MULTISPECIES: hypothetical protein [Mycobacterium]APT09712.1 hypothetical protein BS641_05155 [Mycobacterium avium subsp. hominissuis]ETZ40323.1 hypothetical protein L842_5713 [Mycobacterium intracellulare MIN_052511_1280]KKC01737.1 hypothetical protein WU83_27885 [Mycobacterium nebraskense]OBS01179.1 hypothetical protein A9W98_21330 [Mycobacterium gordonae]OCB43495.1 hypothetical protein A9X02_15010 [Mycobacterium malmoense]ORB64892.1 hypothetical protein BST44_28750 [Mycobacterium scrofu
MNGSGGEHMSARFYDETVFQAWQRGVEIAGPRWFADGQTSPDSATSKWDLSPRVDEIRSAIGWLSSGEAMFLAAMVSFYNSEPGGELLRSLGANGLSDIAASLDESRRQVIADLPLAYAGW